MTKTRSANSRLVRKMVEGCFHDFVKQKVIQMTNKLATNAVTIINAITADRSGPLMAVLRVKLSLF